MGCVVFSIVKALVVLELIWLSCFGDTYGQMQNTVIALEGSNTELTINIPNDPLANTARYITVRHDKGDGQNLIDVLFFINDTIQVRDNYFNVITVTQTGKTLKLQIRNVNAVLAGTFRCFLHGSQTAINDCGQLLIIIRKPDPPTIKLQPMSSTLVGSRLTLECEHYSTSLPPKNGLMSKVWWHDQTGSPINQSSKRIFVSITNQFIIDPVERTDKGLKYYCITADSTGDVTTEVKSSKSADFEVLPEYKPSRTDFVFTPALNNDDIIHKEIGELVNYRCEIDCWPQCNIVWMHKPSTGATDFVEYNLVDKKVLVVSVSRLNDGHFKCKAENKHGVAEQGFQLKTVYLEAQPSVSINGENKKTTRLQEYSQINMKCTFDGNPAPVVNWISPSETTLSTHTADGPNVVVEGGMNRHLYTSTFMSDNLKCEDSGMYRCEGRNGYGSAKEQIELVITCPPSSAEHVPDLGLKNKYVWEISKPLSFQFVIVAFPEPDITQIVSSLNGVMRNELIPTDVDISRTLKYDGKPYLTKFLFTSKRKLGQNDAGRLYTMTMASSEFTRDFAFHVNPRGPPHRAVNLTAIEVDHDSLVLFWIPGFNGGEPQTFSVEHRIPKPSELESGRNYSWTTSIDKIPDGPPDNWISVQVPLLKAETDYVIRVKSVNVLGSSEAEIKITTAAASSSSLGPGAICGIVFGVLIFLIIIAVIIYVIYRQKCGKSSSHGGARKGPLLQQVISLFRRDKYKTRPVTGSKMNGSATNHSPWAKVKKAFISSSSKNSLDYLNVPARDYNTDDNPHESALNNHALVSTTPELGRKMNEDGLIYIEVDFSENNKKKNKNVKTKKNKKKQDNVHKSNESVNYSDIDFTKTSAKKKELEENTRGEATEEEEEPEYEDTAGTTSKTKYADAGFGIGTTV